MEAGAKYATPFHHGCYLTTLLSCAQAKQTYNLYFETWDWNYGAAMASCTTQSAHNGW